MYSGEQLLNRIGINVNGTGLFVSTVAFLALGFIGMHYQQYWLSLVSAFLNGVFFGCYATSDLIKEELTSETPIEYHGTVEGIDIEDGGVTVQFKDVEIIDKFTDNLSDEKIEDSKSENPTMDVSVDLQTAINYAGNIKPNDKR